MRGRSWKASGGGNAEAIWACIDTVHKMLEVETKLAAMFFEGRGRWRGFSLAKLVLRSWFSAVDDERLGKILSRQLDLPIAV